MDTVIELFGELVKYYGHTASSIIMIVVMVMYGVYILLKNYSKLIQRYFENKLIEAEKIHAQASRHRKNITPKIRQRLSELAIETKADRAMLFEFSNGSSNLVGLPFLYVSATCEVVTRNTAPVQHKYQKINVSIIAEFLEKLEDKGYFYTRDIEGIKDMYPMVYSMMHPNQAKSALFYMLSGELDTIGFLVISTVRENEFSREDALPKVAHTAQLISSYLNFDVIHEDV